MMRIVILIVALAQVSFGQLVWEAKQQLFESTTADGRFVTAFPFENKGSKPVRILEITSSCGCTTAKMEKREYAPGEKGKLEVDFLFGGRRGPQNKTFIVRTDVHGEPAAVLTLRGTILELVKVKPSFLYWKQGSPRAPQTLKLQVAQDKPVKILSVDSSDPTFAVELKPVNPGEYEVTVTPQDTSKPGGTTLTIRTDYPPVNPASYKAYAQVK